jgi:hypothetical protein
MSTKKSLTSSDTVNKKPTRIHICNGDGDRTVPVFPSLPSAIPSFCGSCQFSGKPVRCLTKGTEIPPGEGFELILLTLAHNGCCPIHSDNLKDKGTKFDLEVFEDQTIRVLYD